MAGLKEEKIKDKKGLTLDLSFLDGEAGEKYGNFADGTAANSVFGSQNYSEDTEDTQSEADKRLPNSNKFLD